MAKPRTDHIIMRNVPDLDKPYLMGYQMLCLHCLAAWQPKLPCPIDEFLKKAKAFEKKHANCPQEKEKQL